MFPKPIKTYLRKPAKPVSRIPPNPSIPHFSDSENDENDKEHDEPLDDTFDRLRKTAKPVQQVTSSHINNSTIFYNSTSSSDTSELEIIPIPQSLPVASVKRGRKRKTSRNVDKLPQNLLTKNKVSKRNRKQNIGILEEKKKVKKGKNESLELKSLEKKNFSSELIEIDSLDAAKSNFQSEKSGKFIESSKIDVESLDDDQNNSEEIKNLRKQKGVSRRIELNNKSEELKISGEITEKSLSSSNDATNKCWVSLYRIKLRDKIAKEDQNRSTNSESVNVSGPISILVISTPGDDSIEEFHDSQKLQKENSVEEKSQEFSRSLNDDNSSKSSSLFSINESEKILEYDKKLSEDQSKSFSIIDKTLEINEKKDRFSENAIDNCSVVLQRYDTLSKNGNLTFNQTLLSSTPLVTKIRQKGARLQLSPIPMTSSVVNRRNNQSRINDNSLEKENNGDSSQNVIKLTKNMTSISIIDEDTEQEFSESNPSDIISTKVDDSLKDKIEKQLFSSVQSAEESNMSLIPDEKISLRKSNRIASSRENSVMIATNSTIDISSRISDNDSDVKIELETINESSGVTSPLMFEDTEEEEIQNEIEEKSVDDDCESGVENEDETVDSEVGDGGDEEEEMKIGELSSDHSLDVEENDEEIMEKTVEDSRDVSLDDIEEEEEEEREEMIDTTVRERKRSIPKVQLPDVLLTRLNDPIRVTDRRYRYRSRDNRLSAISETVQKRISDISEDKNDPGGDVAEESDGEAIENDIGEVKSVFLKPGKFWARSLSILNNIQNENDLEALGKGKGKNWRQSVISVLNMQSQGLVQSCISNNENKTQSRVSHASPGSTDNATRKWSSANRLNSQPSSPGRFIRRVSIRVVPDNKTSKLIDKVQDPSFLEAYGITTSKDRQTLVQQSKSPVSKSIYNIRNSTSNSSIPEPLTIARNVVLDRCNQTDSCPFSRFYSDEYLKDCRKIGEGVYGEVFMFDNGREKSVIKIIPIEGSEIVNGEPQKKFDEILSEIIIAKELDGLRINETYRTDGFVEVKNIRCLRGKYPDKLVELWESYDEEKKSDNDSPSMFKEEQLYIALELGDGGKDLEGFVFQNASEAYSSFIQTALTLAVAEKSLDFEHRDLHWGNILISRTTEKSIFYKLNGKDIEFPCQGVKVSIIDFTLSRMSYEGCCIFNDLALDPSLFTAAGEYQFEIYKLMRAKVDNNWQAFEPSTNILWLHYTLDKMITAVRYKRKGTKIHNNYIQRLRELMNVILDYESAFNFITNCQSVKELLQIDLTS